ncbi:MAG: hypothetical protein DMD48_07505 [Gemmatimonadetes bacterium]|nr:MAG: hypothetical protein DMD48_07505 [Gemmatimonadota bacterium]
MIKLPDASDQSRAERFALDVLVDLARLVPAGPALDVVRVELSEQAPRALRGWMAAGWGIDVADGVVRVPRAVLQLVIEVAGAASEQRARDRDGYDRVPSSANPLVREGLEREPAIHRAALALQAAARKAAGRRAFRTIAPWPEGHRWAAAFTHDLDVVSWWPAFTLLRMMELTRKGALAQMGRVAAAALRSVGFDPVTRGVTGVLDYEASARIRSTWFILCGTPTLQTMRAGDLTYRPESSKARGILAQVRSAGHEIGLHGSFETLDNSEAFNAQRLRLVEIAGSPVHGIRQHYVRIHPGVTEHAMAEAGFSYDTTFGFPDRNGFRLGVADVVPRWDAAGNHPIAIDEVPFTWMDRALSKYRGVESPPAWSADALELAATARAVGGLWVGLWHPNLTPALGFPDAPPAYGATLAGVLAESPFVAPLDTIVQWCRARRAVRATGITPDGKIEASAGAKVPFQLRLEDADGTAAEATR